MSEKNAGTAYERSLSVKIYTGEFVAIKIEKKNIFIVTVFPEDVPVRCGYKKL